MSNPIDPGEGYRLLVRDETIPSNAQARSGDTWLGIMPTSMEIGRPWDPDRHLPMREPIKPKAPTPDTKPYYPSGMIQEYDASGKLTRTANPEFYKITRREEWMDKVARASKEDIALMDRLIGYTMDKKEKAAWQRLRPLLVPEVSK